ncbi:methyl-accepting chemotaxis protein [Methylibium sp.]|uniref:methyl-accepting chemotaxis protein n=1 Tax=Methylibium sp. TaxID=2067992 RepID=UPI003D0B3C5E
MKLNHLKIGTRLGAGFGAVLLLLVLIVALAFSRLVTTEQGFDSARDVERGVSMADEWKSLTTLNVSRTIAIVKSGGTPQMVSFLTPQMKDTSEQITRVQKELEARPGTDKGKALFADIAEKRKAYIGQRETALALLKAGDAAAVEALLEKSLLPASRVYLAAIEDFSRSERELADQSGAAVKAEVQQSKLLLLVLAAVSIVLGGMSAWVLTRSVTVPLERAAATTRAIAAGNLSQRIEAEGRDEVAGLQRSLAEMQSSLGKMVSAVRLSTDSITTASSEIATGNQDLSARTEQTASNLQETASSMEQLTGTVKQTAESARTANQLASSAQATAAKGGKVVSEVVSTMEDINASSKKIADIIGVIDGIAFQTNILALNAAVEAARAGEQGRGFAVVAGEVRNLAQRSAQAAKEIKDLIGASVERVESGSKLVADAGRTMSEIVGSVQRVSDIIGEITAAAAEQSEGIGQVNTAVTNLDQMTQQNAALVEQSAAAAESLKDQAIRLAASISVFRVDGSDAAVSRPADARQPLAAHSPVRPPASTPRAVSPAKVPPVLHDTAVAGKQAPVVAAAAAGDDWETF